MKKSKHTADSEAFTESENAALPHSGPEELSAPGKKGAGYLFISVLGAFIGMLIGTVPPAIVMYAFGKTVWLLFALMPVLICTGIILLGGFRDWRSVIITIVFSVIGFFLIFLSCQAAGFVRRNGMSVLSIPLVTITSAAAVDGLNFSFNSDGIFPLVFLILGIFMAGEFIFPPIQKQK